MSFISEIKNLSKNSLIYGLSSGIGRFASLFMAPILTRIFSPEDYGVIALVQLAIAFAALFAGSNIGSGISYYYFHFESEQKKRAVLVSGFSVTLLLSVIFASLLYFFSQPISALLLARQQGGVSSEDFRVLLQIASLGLFFAVMKEGFQSLLRLLNLPKRYMIVEMTSLFVNIFAVLVLVVWLRSGLEGVFWASVIASIVSFLIGFFFVVDRFRGVFATTILVSILTYALPQLPGVIINWFQVQLGRIFLTYFASMADLGIYSIAFSLASVLIIATTAFRLAYDPYAMSIMKREDAKEVYAKVYSIYGFVFACVLGGVVALSKPALQILTPAEYHEAHTIVFWLAAAGFFMGANNIVATGIWLSRRTVYTSYAQFISFIVLLFANFLLIPRYGIAGAASAYFLGSFAQSAAYFFFANKLYPIAFRYWRINLLVIMLIMIGWVHTNIVGSMGLLGALMVAVPTTVSSIIVAWYLCFSRLQRQSAWARISLEFQRATG